MPSAAPAPAPPAQSGARVPPQRPAPRPPLLNGTQFRQIFPAPAPGHPVAWLRALADGARFGIEDANTWIGAGAENRIRVANDPAVSWNHACVQWADGDLYLFDNRSTNGSRVNGARMEPGSRVLLRPGDEIRIGHASFALEE